MKKEWKNENNKINTICTGGYCSNDRKFKCKLNADRVRGSFIK